MRCSLLSHTSDIDDLLEGLDGVLEDWFDRLHDTKSSLHIVDLWLHSLDGLHLSGNFNEWLSIIESLEDSGGKSFLDVLDGSGLGNGGITITSGLGSLGRAELGFKVNEEFIFVHLVVFGGSSALVTVSICSCPSLLFPFHHFSEIWSPPSAFSFSYLCFIG